MIIRIVRMEFHEEQVADFLRLFASRKKRIRDFDGCSHLELWQEAGSSHVYFTYSHWESESHLDRYRFSEFFKDTWKQTKALFAAPAQAWSVNRHTLVS